MRGFVINRFDGDAILLSPNGGNIIEGNFIGTDVTGATSRANSPHGVEIFNVPNNRIGGTALGMRNIITATATDPNNNTSEFSQCRQVGNGGVGAGDNLITVDAL